MGASARQPRSKRTFSHSSHPPQSPRPARAGRGIAGRETGVFRRPMGEGRRRRLNVGDDANGRSRRSPHPSPWATPSPRCAGRRASCARRKSRTGRTWAPSSSAAARHSSCATGMSRPCRNGLPQRVRRRRHLAPPQVLRVGPPGRQRRRLDCGGRPRLGQQVSLLKISQPGGLNEYLRAILAIRCNSPIFSALPLSEIA